MLCRMSADLWPLTILEVAKYLRGLGIHDGNLTFEIHPWKVHRIIEIHKISSEYKPSNIYG